LKNDHAEGKDIYYFKTSDKCEGDLKKGRRNGKVIFYSKDDNRYERYWKNGKKEGKEIFILMIVLDMMDIGKMIKKKEKEFYDRFEGDFKNDNIKGKWVWYYHVDDIYKSNFKDGKNIEKDFISIIMVLDLWKNFTIYFQLEA